MKLASADGAGPLPPVISNVACRRVTELKAAHFHFRSLFSRHSLFATNAVVIIISFVSTHCAARFAHERAFFRHPMQALSDAI